MARAMIARLRALERRTGTFGRGRLPVVVHVPMVEPARSDALGRALEIEATGQVVVRVLDGDDAIDALLEHFAP